MNHRNVPLVHCASCSETWENVFWSRLKGIMVTTLHLTLQFPWSAQKMYNNLTSSDYLTRSLKMKCVMSDEPGKSFLLGTNITGKNLQMAPGELILQHIRFCDWPEGHNSMLSLRLYPFEGGCKVVFKQELVPEKWYKQTKTFWAQFWKKL